MAKAVGLRRRLSHRVAINSLIGVERAGGRRQAAAGVRWFLQSALHLLDVLTETRRT